jgi:hypothetical protein
MWQCQEADLPDRVDLHQGWPRRNLSWSRRPEQVRFGVDTADNVEERLALLSAHHFKGALDGSRKILRPLNPFA